MVRDKKRSIHHGYSAQSYGRCRSEGVDQHRRPDGGIGSEKNHNPAKLDTQFVYQPRTSAASRYYTYNTVS